MNTSTNSGHGFSEGGEVPNNKPKVTMQEKFQDFADDTHLDVHTMLRPVLEKLSDAVEGAETRGNKLGVIQASTIKSAWNEVSNFITQFEERNKKVQEFLKAIE